MSKNKKGQAYGLVVGCLLSVLLLSGCSIPLKVIDTTANALVKTATTTIRTTGDIMKTGAGMVGNAATRMGAAAPIAAAAMAAQPVEPSLVP